MPALALTDHGNLYGAIEFYQKARSAGIKPILGLEAYVAPRRRRDKEHGIDNKYCHLTILCRDNTGWKNLIQLVTKSNLEGFYYKPRVDKELLREHSAGLIALSGCYSGEVIKNILLNRYQAAERAVQDYKEIFGAENFFIEVGQHPNIGPGDFTRVRSALIELSRKTGTPLVATQDIHYLKKEDAPYHDILLAVQTVNQITDENRLTLKNDDFSMRSAEEMTNYFQDIPEAIENTGKIADRCQVNIPLGKAILPEFTLPDGENANSYLEKLVKERLASRYQLITPEIQERIDHELAIIEKTGFAGYFLIVQDFINWAKERSIVVGPGRGSAAGSIISYILGITSIDPLKHDLLFERFLNPDRNELPDIDIDFSDLRRDEVLGYLREKYGDDRVANIITFGTMAARAAVRDTGRALGMAYSFCDRLAKLIPFNQNLDKSLETISQLKQLYASDADTKKIIDAARRLEGVARHASVHACGVVIGDRPLAEYLPLQFAPQDEKTIITQFEMHAVESLGLLKIDLLGLKNLTIIEETSRLIREGGKSEVDVNQLADRDPETFAMLQRGDTTGVFQFESAGMRRYIKELKPTELEDLVVLVSLYRPGPMELIPAYIRRKHGQEQITYLHPRLEPIMKKTFGIGVYQEQMMKIARDLAGYTLAEADILRKAIGKKIKSLLDQQREKIIKGMMQNGINERIAKAIWELFPPFARYGFNRAHAVSYATIGYQTAYLRAHYPTEFMTALLNADAGDVERIAFLVSECKKININVLPPDINKSWTNFTPEGQAIRFGLLAVKNVGKAVVEAIIENRQQQGSFTNLKDLLNRVHHKDLNKKSLESLIKCGALDCLEIERNQALENINELIKFNSAVKRYHSGAQTGLFGSDFTGSLRLAAIPPAATQTKLQWEKELLGLFISDHPLNAYRQRLAGSKSIREALATHSENLNLGIGGIITKVQKIVTRNGQPMLFAKVEDFENSIEIVVFPDALGQNNDLWQEGKIILANGRMSWRNNEPKFICNSAQEI